MKTRYFNMAAVTLSIAMCAAAALIFFPPDFALTVHMPSLHDITFHVAPMLFAAGAELDAARTKHKDLVARAAAKIGEVKEGLAPEAVRKIEEEHAAILKEAADLAGQIAESENAARSGSNPGWSVADMKKVQARAAAFGLAADAALDVMGRTSTIDEATDALQNLAAAKQPKRQSPQLTIVSDEGDKRRAAVANAIQHRANPGVVKLEDAAREYRGMSIMEMGRTYLEEDRGLRLRGLSKRELANVLLGLETRAGMMSTSDFPGILSNVVNKRLREVYAAYPQSWKLFSRQSNAPDFKQKAVLALSEAPAFKEVKEGAEYTYGAFTEGKEVYALSTYGRIVAITRQTLINDDLGAFDRIPTMLARQAAENEANIVWSILTSNPNMGDSIALFHASHGNLASPGTATTVAGLNDGRASMRKQKSLAAKSADRVPMNLMPKFLVVSPDKETEAQQFLASIVAATPGNVNPFANSLTQITEARLTGNAWFLVVDPAIIDTIEYAYLEGEEGLYTEERIGFEVDGLEIKAREDFAAKAIDYRGFYKNPGN